MKPESATTFEEIEKQRVRLQAKLDEQKTQSERNRLGQFSTPPNLADEILRYALSLVTSRKVRFLDPAFGTGAFYSALCRMFPKNRIEEALGIEIDAEYGRVASQLWKGSDLQLRLEDFITATSEPRFNLVICNPPYVRHHHLGNGDKQRLRMRTTQASGIKLSGLAGLYCHFICMCHAWMAQDAIAGWLVPSQFMDVNYGRGLREYLLRKVTLLHIHRFNANEVQFADALVSSAVLWFRNSPPPKDHRVRFSFGGTLLEPQITKMVSAEALAHEHKWTRFPVANVRPRSTEHKLADLFHIKRGLATGDNGYFILSEAELEQRDLPMEAFRPILPGPRYLLEDEVSALVDGTPQIERRLFLLDTRLPESDIRKSWPKLYEYLKEGEKKGLHSRYLCSHRTPWYAQENRPAAPIVCTYLGRGDKKNGRPFRFILNHSKATVANVYLAMYPTPFLSQLLKCDSSLLRRIWTALNAIPAEQLLAEGRLYGGGLHKLEPGELAQLDASSIFSELTLTQATAAGQQLRIFEGDAADIQLT
jgi:methylase of polypeptide subunit release factors